MSKQRHAASSPARRNKLVMTVPANYSSQEWAECGHTATESRLSQAASKCVARGHADNADHNAARVLKKRAADTCTASEKL